MPDDAGSSPTADLSPTTGPLQGRGSDGQDHGLKRTLTGRQLSMMGLGGAIGTGLFLGSGLAISAAGPASVLAYVLCALIALVIGWALAEMTAVHPATGSFGTIGRHYLGPLAGFVIRWTYWTIQVIAIGGEVIAAGIYVRFWWPELPLWTPVVAFSLLLLAANALTVGVFGRLEYWFSTIKITAIGVFVLLGCAYVFLGLPGHEAVGASNLSGPGGLLPHGMSGLGTAFVFVIFSYIGTEIIAVTAAESENPVRDIPRAARRMVVRLALFYVLAMAVVVTVVPWSRTAAGGDVTASPFVQLFDVAGIPAAAGIMNFVVLTAALSSANANTYLATRMIHSLAVDRHAPRTFARVGRGGVPHRALAVSGLGLGAAAILSVHSEDTAYVLLFGISVFGALVVWILILATHLMFRRHRARHGLPASPARLRGAPLTTIAAALALAAILVSTAFIDGLEDSWKAGLPFFALLIVAYRFGARRYETAEPLPDSTLPPESSDARPPGARLPGARLAHAHGEAPLTDEPSGADEGPG
ncbi:amino acid permease [Streptomyces sp. NPDC001940]|uniref:amino acid permease n=1 Tax=unclassified Streptomyces TaxID=2593676 RepID=UPI0036312D59